MSPLRESLSGVQSPRPSSQTCLWAGERLQQEAATLLVRQQWVSLASSEPARAGTRPQGPPQVMTLRQLSWQRLLRVRSNVKPAGLWSRTLLARQSCLRFHSPIIFMPSFPCWRSGELSSLPICKPHRTLHLNVFLLPVPCCWEGPGHGDSFHLLSFLVMIQSWWLLASALRVSGLLQAVARRFAVRWYVEERCCGPFWINRLPDCEA